MVLASFVFSEDRDEVAGAKAFAQRLDVVEGFIEGDLYAFFEVAILSAAVERSCDAKSERRESGATVVDSTQVDEGPALAVEALFEYGGAGEAHAPKDDSAAVAEGGVEPF